MIKLRNSVISFFWTPILALNWETMQNLVFFFFFSVIKAIAFKGWFIIGSQLAKICENSYIISIN
jgi:hypothetical protein